MGWCHEFGPQITEGCEHPMEAGPSSCTCSACGTVCTGKFSGCDDVWARGPRPVVVSVPPVRPVAALVPDLEPGLEDESHGDLALDLRASVANRSAAAVVDDLARRVEELEARAERTPPPPSVSDSDSEPSAPAELVDQLSRLEADVSALGELSQRISALEQSRGAPATGLAEKAVVVMSQRLERLTAQVAELDDVTGELQAGRPDEGAADRDGVGVVAKGLAEAEARLDKVVADVASLQPVLARLDALEKAHGRLAELEAVVEGVGGRVEALGRLPERMAAFDKVLLGLIKGMERLSADVATVGDVARRVCALEDAAGPNDKLVAALAKRVDRLSTHAAAVKDTPARLEALEQAVTSHRSEEVADRLDALGGQTAALAAALDELPRREEVVEEVAARTSSLARGLGGAIDMIDQLSAQLVALEQGTGNGTLASPDQEEPASAALRD